MRNINVYVIVKVLHFVNRDVNAKAMGQDLFSTFVFASPLT